MYKKIDLEKIKEKINAALRGTLLCETPSQANDFLAACQNVKLQLQFLYIFPEIRKIIYTMFKGFNNAPMQVKQDFLTNIISFFYTHAHNLNSETIRFLQTVFLKKSLTIEMQLVPLCEKYKIPISAAVHLTHALDQYPMLTEDFLQGLCIKYRRLSNKQNDFSDENFFLGTSPLLCTFLGVVTSLSETDLVLIQRSLSKNPSNVTQLLSEFFSEMHKLVVSIPRQAVVKHGIYNNAVIKKPRRDPQESRMSCSIM